MIMTGDVPSFSQDPVQDRARKELLVKLAANTRHPAMAELAQELLAGHVTPRQIVTSQLYADVLEGGTNDFSTWYGALSEEERDAEATNGQQATRQLADELPTEPPTGPGRRHRGENDDDVEDFSDRSWLRGR
jgi:hypothetical protein